MPRRAGPMTVWSFANSAAIGDHMSPVLPKPWIKTTAGPWPPTRTLIVASALITRELRKSAGKGVGAASADGAPSTRLSSMPAASRRKQRENAGKTAPNILGSFLLLKGPPPKVAGQIRNRSDLDQIDRNIDVAASGVGMCARETLAFQLSPNSAEISKSVVLRTRVIIGPVSPSNNLCGFPGRLAFGILAP